MREKAVKAKAKAIALRDERDLKFKAQKSIDKIQNSIGAPMLYPLLDQGIAYFMANYAIGLDQPPLQSESYHRHLSTHGFHPIIATSMTALGLAGISNLCMNANFQREAMKWYLKALQMTNTALQSTTEVKSDNTLLATMLLSMFESTHNDTSLVGWSQHVDGSASLLRMRGASQFSTPAGRRMYMQTVGLLAMNCMGKGSPLPDYVHEMNKESKKYEDENDPPDRYYHLHIATIDFRAHVLQGKISKLEDIISRALELDQEAQDVFKSVGQEWAYEAFYTEGTVPGVFGSYYHVYPHMTAAQTWNWVRYNRIYLHDIIRNCLIVGFSMTPPALIGEKYAQLLQRSTQTLYTMQADILASIPQHLHDTPKSPMVYQEQPTSPSVSSTSSADSPSSPPVQTKFFWSNFCETDPPQTSVTSTMAKDRLPIIRVSGGYSSLWALYTAGATPVATPESQEFVLKSFDRIANEFGINQAKVLSSALKMKIQLDTAGDQPFELVPTYLPQHGEHVSAWSEEWVRERA